MAIGFVEVYSTVNAAGVQLYLLEDMYRPNLIITPLWASHIDSFI